MICVDFYPNQIRMVITGTTEDAFVGPAAGSHSDTLRYNVEFIQDKGWLEDMRILNDYGLVEISCVPIPKKRNAVMAMFNWISMGFFLLAADHPKEVVCNLHMDDKAEK